MAGLDKRRWKRAALLGGVCVAVAAVGATVASSQSSPGESSSSVQPGIFSANIRSGPDRGLAVWGVLSGKVATSGRISGALKGNQPGSP